MGTATTGTTATARLAQRAHDALVKASPGVLQEASWRIREGVLATLRYEGRRYNPCVLTRT